MLLGVFTFLPPPWRLLLWLLGVTTTGVGRVVVVVVVVLPVLPSGAEAERMVMLLGDAVDCVLSLIDTSGPDEDADLEVNCVVRRWTIPLGMLGLTVVLRSSSLGGSEEFSSSRMTRVCTDGRVSVVKCGSAGSALLLLATRPTFLL